MGLTVVGVGVKKGKKKKIDWVLLKLRTSGLWATLLRELQDKPHLGQNISQKNLINDL